MVDRCELIANGQNKLLNPEGAIPYHKKDGTLVPPNVGNENADYVATLYNRLRRSRDPISALLEGSNAVITDEDGVIVGTSISELTSKEIYDVCQVAYECLLIVEDDSILSS